MFKRKKNTGGGQTTVYLGLGSNLGDRADYINSALNSIANSKGIRLVNMSKMVETKALGDVRQPDYFNRVAQIKTKLDPEKLLDKLQFIEEKLGRTKKGDNSSRTIDIDIILYGDRVIKTDALVVPHERMHLRSFVLNGICEMDGSMAHPVMGKSIEELAKRLCGQDFVIREDVPKLISFAGVIGVGKTTLARSLALMADARLIEEEYDKNPYLADVYAGDKSKALDSELFFVNSSASQLGRESLSDEKLYVNDYIFNKAFVYAKRWLDEDKLLEYKKEYVKFEAKAVKPSVVLYLKDDLWQCVERIKTRNRPYEQQIEEKFLAQLQADYDELFGSWKHCPVIEVDCRNVDCLDGDNIRELVKDISYYI
jgi:deoxyguanosine kinase